MDWLAKNEQYVNRGYKTIILRLQLKYINKKIKFLKEFQDKDTILVNLYLMNKLVFLFTFNVWYIKRQR